MPAASFPHARRLGSGTDGAWAHSAWALHTGTLPRWLGSVAIRPTVLAESDGNAVGSGLIEPPFTLRTWLLGHEILGEKWKREEQHRFWEARPLNGGNHGLKVVKSG